VFEDILGRYQPILGRVVLQEIENAVLEAESTKVGTLRINHGRQSEEYPWQRGLASETTAVRLPIISLLMVCLPINCATGSQRPVYKEPPPSSDGHVGQLME
jgi:hypothetical protein